MADVMTQEKNSGKSPQKKKNIRIDMTPMVDLGFLLITFFMFASSFNKPNVMDLGLPAGDQTDGIEIDYRNQLTFILGENDRMFYYQNELKNLQKSDLKEIIPDGMNVSKLINAYKKAAPKPENFTIIIKPTDDANYKNFVDMIDEMAITKNERYGISDLKPQEEKIYDDFLK